MLLLVRGSMSGAAQRCPLEKLMHFFSRWENYQSFYENSTRRVFVIQPFKTTWCLDLHLLSARIIKMMGFLCSEKFYINFPETSCRTVTTLFHPSSRHHLRTSYWKLLMADFREVVKVLALLISLHGLTVRLLCLEPNSSPFSVLGKRNERPSGPSWGDFFFISADKYKYGGGPI